MNTDYAYDFDATAGGSFSGSQRGSTGTRLRGQTTTGGNGGAGGLADNKRRFYLVDSRGNKLGGEYRSKTPSGAATKAATRGYRDIFLYEPANKRVYSYEGWQEPVDTINEFTSRHGISHRGKVKSRGYYNSDGSTQGGRSKSQTASTGGLDAFDRGLGYGAGTGTSGRGSGFDGSRGSASSVFGTATGNTGGRTDGYRHATNTNTGSFRNNTGGRQTVWHGREHGSARSLNQRR